MILKHIDNEMLQWIAVYFGIVLLAFATAMYIIADIGKGSYIGFFDSITIRCAIIIGTTVKRFGDGLFNGIFP